LTDEHRDRTLVFHGQRLECVFRQLVAEHGVCSILVEAGGELVGRLLDEGWVDELVVYLAPLLSGGETPAVGGEGAPNLPSRLRLEGVRFIRIGSDVRLRGVLGAPGGPLDR
jgi:riboflavin biosynthesis pyrimidine reductase